MDATPPVITLDQPTDEAEDMDGYVEFNYTAFDRSNDIVNCSLYLSSIRNDTIFYGSSNASKTRNGSVNGSFKLTLNDTYLKEDLLWYVRCWDNTTNKSQAINHLGNSSRRYLHTAPRASNYGSNSNDGQSSSSTNMGDVGIVGGRDVLLRSGKSAKFTHDNEQHTLKVNSLNTLANTAEITVSSTPTTATLSAGVPRHFNIDTQAGNDVSITLVKIESNKATINVKEYVAPVTAQPAPPITGDATGREATQRDTTTGDETTKGAPEGTGTNSTAWIIIAAVVLIAIVAYVTINKKK